MIEQFFFCCFRAPLPLLLFIFLLLGGCTGRVPVPLPLSPSQQEQALALLEQLRNRSCPEFIDVDLNINWQGYGISRTLPAALQCTGQGALRVSLLDPLGRPWMILAGDGEEFTLIDNRQGLAWQGKADSGRFRDYLPETLSTRILFKLVTAQIPDSEPLVGFGGGDASGDYRYVFQEDNGDVLQVDVAGATGRLQRQRIIDRQGQVRLDVRYEYTTEKTSGCEQPVIIEVTGSAMKGTLRLKIEQWYPEPLPDDLFEVEIPSHFHVMPQE